MNRTLVRSYNILQMISESSEGLTLKEIAESMNIPKSSAFDIVQTLVSLHLAEPSRHNEKRYVLGSKLYSLGVKYITNSNLVEVCQLYLEPLADKLHRNAFVGVLEDDKVVYIHKYVGGGAKLATCNVGSNAELYYTALGKSLLAFSEPVKRERLINMIHFEKRTERTITSKEQLLKECEIVQRRGYAMDDREYEAHMLCFSCPIFDYTNQVVAAISLSDMYSSDVDRDAIGHELMEVAAKISRRLGYTK